MGNLANIVLYLCETSVKLQATYLAYILRLKRSKSGCRDLYIGLSVLTHMY
jgi:hypothetical protein